MYTLLSMKSSKHLGAQDIIGYAG